jgi:hypothetical protein
MAERRAQKNAVFRAVNEQSARARLRLAVHFFVFFLQFFARFFVIGVRDNTIDRADILTLGRVVMANTLGTFVRIDFVNFFALRDGVIRAFRFAHIAVDAVFSDQKSHNNIPFWDKHIE